MVPFGKSSSFGTGTTSLAWQVGSALKLRGVIISHSALGRLPSERAGAQMRSVKHGGADERRDVCGPILTGG